MAHKNPLHRSAGNIELSVLLSAALSATGVDGADDGLEDGNESLGDGGDDALNGFDHDDLPFD